MKSERYLHCRIWGHLCQQNTSSASQKVLKFWTIRVATLEFNNCESIKINLQIRFNPSTEQTLMPTTSESSTKSDLADFFVSWPPPCSPLEGGTVEARKPKDCTNCDEVPANEGGGSLGCGSGHLVERADSAGLSKRALSGCKPRKLCWFPAVFYSILTKTQTNRNHTCRKHRRQADILPVLGWEGGQVPSIRWSSPTQTGPSLTWEQPWRFCPFCFFYSFCVPPTEYWNTDLVWWGVGATLSFSSPRATVG